MGVGNYLPLLFELLSQIRGRKAEKVTNVIGELIQDYEAADELFDRLEEAAKAGTAVTFAPEEVSRLAEVRDDLTLLFERLKIKLKKRS